MNDRTATAACRHTTKPLNQHECSQQRWATTTVGKVKAVHINTNKLFMHLNHEFDTENCASAKSATAKSKNNFHTEPSRIA